MAPPPGIRGRRACLVLLLAVSTLLACPQAESATRSYVFHAIQGSPSEPVRWNPCTAITYRINPNGVAGTAAINRVWSAVAEASRATGIPFKYLGRTAVVPDDTYNPTKGTTADLVITWARSGYGSTRSAMLPSDNRVAGIGGYSTMHTNKGFELAHTGYVVFNSGHVFTMSARRQYVVALHELGHVLGLGDVSDGRQIMNGSVLANGPSHYATGDLSGLHRLGRSAGCLVPAPTPKPPAVVRSGNKVSVATAPVVSVSGPVTYALSSPELGTIASSTTPDFTVPLDTIADRGYAGRAVRFQVRASNRVGATTSTSSDYRVPAAVLTQVPKLVASPSSLDLVDPKAVLSGTSVDVSDRLVVTTTGTVSMYKESGLIYTGELFWHMLNFGLPVWQYDVSGFAVVTGAGLNRTVDLSGSYRTSAWQPPPPPEPTPTPTPDPTPDPTGDPTPSPTADTTPTP
ncbi:hypothetical protein [Nocardioides marmorisolisilvae]|uniref:hypothetical protein n=1 Tax=Nocardioides marmorisolisilvae TaxID=1542737 RepID=UPI00161A2249|nr:hypothetical protein [Nocardioides marmorisolisilvae]